MADEKWSGFTSGGAILSTDILVGLRSGVNVQLTPSAIIPVTAGSLQMLQSNGAAAPLWSTSIWPATTTINQILYSSSANTIAGLSTANNGVLITSGAGVPSISSTLPNAVQLNITNVGTISAGIWNGTGLTVPYGGTGVASTTAYALLAGGTTSVAALQSLSTGSIGQLLISQGNAALPIFTTATFPTTAVANQIFYGSATNVIGQLATAVNGVLITDGTVGIPSISSTLPSAVQANITTVGTIGTGVWNATNIAVAHGGTGVSSFTAYGLIAGGTTSTGNLQSIADGNSGQIMQSAGNGGLPGWTIATYPGTLATQYQILYVSAANVVSGMGVFNNGTLVTSATGQPSILAGSGTTGNILQTNAVAAPSWSTATYPSTTTINQILYSSAANVVSGITAVNSAFLLTNASGVPSLSTTVPFELIVGATTAYAVLINGNQTAVDGSSNAGGYISLNTFTPTNGGNVIAAINSNPTFIAPNTKTITSACGEYIYNTYSSNVGTISNAYGIFIDTGTSGAGTINNAYGLYCKTPTAGSGNYCAIFTGGTVGIGVTAPNTLSSLNVQSSNYIGIQHNGSVTLTGSNTQFGILCGATFNPTGGASNKVANIASQAIFNAPTATTIAAAYGLYVTNTYNTNVGTITSAAGIYIDTGSNAGGTLTNSYGLYCNTPTGGSNIYTAIFTGGTPLVGIGTATPSTLSALNINNTNAYGIYVNGTKTIVDGGSAQTDLLSFSTFQPTNGSTISTGIYLAPTFIAPSAKTITNSSGAYVNNVYSSNIGTLTTVYGILIGAGGGGAGTITNSYGLYVNTQTSASNNYCAYFSGVVGIGISNPSSSSMLIVNGTTPYGIVSQGNHTSVDGGSNQWGVLCQGAYTPTNGSGFSTSLYLNEAFIAPSAKTITNAAGMYVNNIYSSNIGTITNIYGIWINSSGSGAGTITNSYNLYVNTPSAGTNKYTAIIGDANNTARIGMGTASPDANSILNVSTALAYSIKVSGTQTAADGGTNQLGILNTATLNPTNGSNISTGFYCGLSFIAPSTKTITNAFGVYISNTYNSNVGTISGVVNLYIGAGSGGAGTITNAYGMQVFIPTCATTNYCATFNAPIYVTGDDSHGFPGGIGFTNVINTTQGAGINVVKSTSAGANNNTGYIKFWNGTTAVYVPYWNTP